ncbi:MFS general substrate transporter [Aureobasidium pullulans EXF-150]|uniref:MFS general substrate transporter n=1 Tax=Aureobasidium pullulans EXF-150 TaxID=1043002 RepID=A0A074Y1F2_AURPU|nr:MFS general substrate transporter [Aureobasidium pullulans EXF-150]KEQ89759.1 MFS general substrate transporter [Aureobasidium pullulans EXF-150]THZ91781.1 MFS general substrate transporter [Aureobasidium pullulans]
MGLFKKDTEGVDPQQPQNDIAHEKDLEKNFEDVQLEQRQASVDNGGSAPFIDPVIEKRVIRKLDWHLVPLLMALYLLAFLDRSNIGNAKIAGMKDALNLTDDRYSWLLTIFYISYILFQFQVLGWKRFPPHIWAAWAIFGWGVISSCQAVVTTWEGEMVLRFLLGVFEAAFGPGVPYLLSFFYLRHEVGFRSGIFLAAAPLATCFAGALAYGITSGKASIPNWKLLFLVEGLPTLAMVPIAYFFLPDSPQKAKFLTEDEKRVAIARGVRQTGTTERVGRIKFRDVGLTFIDPKAICTALMYFSCNVSFSSLPVFLPTILEEMGFESITAQGLSAPPYFLSFLITIASAYIADKTQQRGLTIIILSIVGGVGYVMLATTTGTGPRYAGVFLAASGVFPCIANILPWVTNNQGNDDRRGAAFVLLNFIGQCGPLLGTRIYNDAPFYVKGQSICAAFMFFNGILALSLRTLLAYENRKLDKQYGTIEEQKNRIASTEGSKEAGIEANTGVENFGPMYRYVL